MSIDCPGCGDAPHPGECETPTPNTVRVRIGDAVLYHPSHALSWSPGFQGVIDSDVFLCGTTPCVCLREMDPGYAAYTGRAKNVTQVKAAAISALTTIPQPVEVEGRVETEGCRKEFDFMGTPRVCGDEDTFCVDCTNKETEA